MLTNSLRRATRRWRRVESRKGAGPGTSVSRWFPFAESARGISPRAAHRTGRKPLDLSGSCHPLKAAAFH